MPARSRGPVSGGPVLLSVLLLAARIHLASLVFIRRTGRGSARGFGLGKIHRPPLMPQYAVEFAVTEYPASSSATSAFCRAAWLTAHRKGERGRGTP